MAYVCVLIKNNIRGKGGERDYIRGKGRGRSKREVGVRKRVDDKRFGV